MRTPRASIAALLLAAGLALPSVAADAPPAKTPLTLERIHAAEPLVEHWKELGRFHSHGDDATRR